MATAVASSLQFMWKLPSPAMLITRASGLATCAPSAAPRPKPIVPSPPERNELARMAEAVELRRPHLMLAHVGGR